MLSFEALQVLDAIDKQGSFSAAAHLLDKAPSSLSYQVQKLEQDLDVVIFDRSGHRAVFTDAGKLLLQRGRDILHSADELVADTQSLAHGWEKKITLGYDSLLYTPSLFPLIDRLNQQKDVHIYLQEKNLVEAWQALIEERLDLLIAPKCANIAQELKCQEIGYSEQLWVAASNHPIHKQTSPFKPESLALFRIICYGNSEFGHTQSHDKFSSLLSHWTVSTIQAKYHAIMDGYGIGTLPASWVADAVAEGTIKPIRGTETIKMPWVIAWKRNRIGNAKSWLIRQLPSGLSMLR